MALRRIKIPGLELAGLSWGSAGAPNKILAIHGWMDNAASMAGICERLAGPDREIVAIDLPGHGHSEHLPAAAEYTAPKYVLSVAAALSSLGWLGEEALGLACVARPEDGGGKSSKDRATGDAPPEASSGPDVVKEGDLDKELKLPKLSLVGHSLGAGVVVGVAAALGPRVVDRIVLVEGIGFLTRPDDALARTMLDAIRSRAKTMERIASGRAPRAFPSFEAALQARIATVAMFPGDQTLSPTAAKDIVQRGTITHPDGSVSFRHDPRLRESSPSYLTERQVQSLLASCTSPSLLIEATKGFPMEKSAREARLEALQPQKTIMVDSSHHAHIEPETQTQIQDAIHEFLA